MRTRREQAKNTKVVCRVQSNIAYVLKLFDLMLDGYVALELLFSYSLEWKMQAVWESRVYIPFNRWREALRVS
eukprot:scaffold341_cov368-Pavlova_lutheri.AAC.8